MVGTVVFTFDNMGAAAEIGTGDRVGPQTNAHEETTGYPWLLDFLDDVGLSVSFFLEGWNGLHNPDRVSELVERGHDVGLHGWVHERWGRLTDHDAKRLIHDGTAALRRCGAASTMFRAPGGTSTAATRSCLAELGYTIDASLHDGSTTSAADQLACVSFEWPLVDGYYYLHLHPDDPAASTHLERAWLDRIEQVEESGGSAVFIAHAFLSGATADRRGALERVIRTAIASPNIEVTSLATFSSTC